MNLLCVGGLGGKGCIHCLLEGEGEEGGEPGVARGAHLSQGFQAGCQAELKYMGVLKRNFS